MSVQAEVERALSTVANHPGEVVCAGRTDTGVHASAQVIHFDTTADRGASNWVRGANTHLPATIAIQWAQPVQEGFHARFSARSRHYRYFLLLAQYRTPFAHKAVTRLNDSHLDCAAMNEGCQFLLGEQDFSSFRGAGCQSNTAVRCVQSLNVIDHGSGLIEISVRANAFLLHMVRNITGCLLEVGRGRLAPQDVQNLLAAKDRTLAPPTALPDGLYLAGVEYDAEHQLPPPPKLWLFPDR